MKKLIYSIVALTFLIVLNSCDCKEVSSDMQNEIDFLNKIISEQQSTIAVKEDLGYCTSIKAVEEGSEYCTLNGKATLIFRVPKTHRLTLDRKKSKPSKNILYYICDGDEYSDDTEDRTEEISSLRSGEKAKGAKLKVYLKHTFKTNKCTTNDVLQEKHKGTVVTGEPFEACD
ncbi:MAG: hypothetical protein QM478_04855 [Flavobacteriaceae bacterium]